MDSETERLETVVIGGGQAGLAVGYHLARRDREFVILDANERVGDSWRNRYDSLRLFTPSQYDGLPGWPLPAPAWTFPTKDEMADYLETYRATFDLPVRNGVRVEQVLPDGDHYVVISGGSRFETENVVVATGGFQTPFVPPFAGKLDSHIVQLHASRYRNPAQLRDGDVLVVGAGNSGVDIALDVAEEHRTWLSGNHPGHVPVRIARGKDRALAPVLWFVGTHVLTTRTPIGRKIRPKVLSKGGPLIRVKPKEISAAGIERAPRTVGVQEGLPVLDDGRVLEVSSVIWATGYRPDFGWIKLPVFDERGRAVQRRGVVPSAPGLYFVGQEFMYAFTSALIGGVGRDARYVAKRIESSTSGRMPRVEARV